MSLAEWSYHFADSTFQLLKKVNFEIILVGLVFPGYSERKIFNMEAKFWLFGINNKVKESCYKKVLAIFVRTVSNISNTI